MSLSPDQKCLAIGRGDHIRLFDLTDSTRPMIRDLPTPNDPVQSLAWSGDGHWLATGGYRQIRLWDAQSSWTEESAIVGLTGRVTALETR